MSYCHTVVADPPWKESGGGGRGAQNHYDLMSLKDIRRTIMAPMKMVHKDAHCWIWVTDTFLRDGLALLDYFGFRYIRTLQWVKMRDNTTGLDGARVRTIDLANRDLQIGLGQFLRGSHEMALLGVRGKTMLPAPAVRRPSVVFAERTKHSRKPVEAIEVFEATSPGPYLELFSRGTDRPGWSTWGAEA